MGGGVCVHWVFSCTEVLQCCILGGQVPGTLFTICHGPSMSADLQWTESFSSGIVKFCSGLYTGILDRCTWYTQSTSYAILCINVRSQVAHFLPWGIHSLLSYRLQADKPKQTFLSVWPWTTQTTTYVFFPVSTFHLHSNVNLKVDIAHLLAEMM